MTHKAGHDFFKVKLEWSKRKDLVLGDYLTPYLPAIATQRRPVLIVDGFAGPGRFEDGQSGSPIIICEAVKRALAYPSPGRFEVWAIEKDQSLANALTQTLAAYSAFCRVITRGFTETLDDIEAMLATHNAFLYLDPFTVSGLEWNALDRVFARVGRETSVEVLLNFNVAALARVATAAVGHRFQFADDAESAMVDENSTTAAGITAVLGGDWWREVVRSAAGFPAACTQITSGYLDKLRTRFNEVCYHEIKERDRHSVAKYVLVFGSRHPKALRLMNDAMAKSLKLQAERESLPDPLLFEMRAETLVPDVDKLPQLLFGALTRPMRRQELVDRVIRDAIGQYTQTEMRGAIRALLKDGKLRPVGEAGRLNDDSVLVRAATA